MSRLYIKILSWGCFSLSTQTVDKLGLIPAKGKSLCGKFFVQHPASYSHFLVHNEKIWLLSVVKYGITFTKTEEFVI